ncbi:LPS export ABC transporter permease LptF [Candidatus Hoaglandella endobia]|uniref:LPS export ABC transporter permease LptF n=1 Tax=Candidatus Hoaglandella endobia TaxID=1778263 RepID=UPI00082EBD7E|nr:LPS export ABC transporter permease LptF [Candidatus Hoaglandella endobia]
MIITKYLVWEIFKNQLAILFVLFLIFFCQKLVRILGASVDGDIPINLMVSLLWLGMPEMAQLILPLSLFMGLLMTLSRMYTENEITVMYACGLGKNVLIRATLILSIITALLAAVNVIWISPWSSRHQNQVISEAHANPNIAVLIERQFKPLENGNLVLFIGKIKEKIFEHVFLAQLNHSGKMRPSVVMADRGHIIHRPDGSQLIILDKGTRYEGTALLRDFRITHFNQYKTIIGHRTVTADRIKAEQMNMHQLWQSSDTEARAELHWRITLVISVLIMAMISFPLSSVNPRKRRVLNMLPAMMLYLIFFLLQTSMHSNGARGKHDPMLWIWLTNTVYLVLALVINLWDSLPARRLRRRLWYVKGTV